VLFQNDDYGKDVLKGLKDGLGNKTGMIIAEMPYETGDPTVDSQVVALKASEPTSSLISRRRSLRASDQEGRRTRLEAGSPPQQRLELDWFGDQAGGFENAKGILSTAYQKDPRTRA
jgi:branched-chain amino acid transport system substrate-binding protein